MLSFCFLWRWERSSCSWSLRDGFRSTKAVINPMSWFSMSSGDNSKGARAGPGLWMEGGGGEAGSWVGGGLNALASNHRLAGYHLSNFKFQHTICFRFFANEFIDGGNSSKPGLFAGLGFADALQDDVLALFHDGRILKGGLIIGNGYRSNLERRFRIRTKHLGLYLLSHRSCQVVWLLLIVTVVLKERNMKIKNDKWSPTRTFVPEISAL